MSDRAEAPEDLGAPQSYLVLADGTPVYDKSGAGAGKVAHVLAEDVFIGLVLETADGHRFARADVVSGIFERAVIIKVPVAELPTPSDSAASPDDDSLSDGLRRAWEWLVKPR